MKNTYKKQPARVLARKSARGGGKSGKQIQRAWNLATRLEYRRIKGKGAGK